MSIFEADAEGFRAQNADRPPEHLVREAIQNALDAEGVASLNVVICYGGPRLGTTVTITDDGPGVTDPRLLFTIWMSDKQDSPKKRGRMGRGLKELISVADKTTIRSSACDALVFERFRGQRGQPARWERHEKPRLGRPDRGTEIQAFCQAWGEMAAQGIVAFVRKIRAPAGVTLRITHEAPAIVNPQPEVVSPFVATERYGMKLPTTFFDAESGERVERERIGDCTVECFTPPPGEKAHVYEMGIPVEACESPVSIDVGQRVILRERRDTLTEAYKRQLYARVLSYRLDAGLVPAEQLRDNAAIIAAASTQHLSYKACERIAQAWTEGKPYAASPATRAQATGHHIEVANLRGMPEAIRNIVSLYGKNVLDVLKERRSELCPAIETTERTDDQNRLKTFWEWCAQGIGRACTVLIRQGNPAMADFNRDGRVLSVYVGGVAKDFFETPAGAKQLGVLNHELAHWEPKEDEHGAGFAHDNDDVGGALAAFLLNNAEQARTLLRR